MSSTKTGPLLSQARGRALLRDAFRMQVPVGGAKRTRGTGRGGDGLTIRHFFGRAPQ